MEQSGRVHDVFARVMEAPPHQRADVIADECGDDVGLRAEVMSLLDALSRAGDFLRQHVEPGEALGEILDGRHEALHRTPIADENLSGATIGPYKLLERIGEGGFGAVYMAEQSHPIRRRVALKILKPGMDSRRIIARFQAERQALAMMDHPNIAHVFDAGTTSLEQGSRPYFVMELVRGLPITQYCDENRLTPRERLALLVPVCHAVQHAHQKGVIHRDLKPSNVLVTLHDGEPVPKVIDFGIAKATSQPLTEATVFTEFRQLIGTPAYMSPEQAEMSGLDIDTRSDVYSLGVLMYELLTGSTPFESSQLLRVGIAEMQRMIREQDPPKPSTRVSTLGERLTAVADRRRTEPSRLGRLVRGELDWIVMKAMEKDRRRRYDSASALAADVQRFLSGEPVQAAPPSVAYRVLKFTHRHRAPMALGTTVFLALLGMLIGTTLALSVVRHERDQTRAQRDRADEALVAEELARTTAETRLAMAERQAYRAQMSAAQGDIAFGRGFDAAHQLMQTPEHLRGWEWEHLMLLADPVIARFEPDWTGPTSVAISEGGRWIVVHPLGSTRVSLIDARTCQRVGYFDLPEGFGWPIRVDDRGRILVHRDDGALAFLEPGRSGPVWLLTPETTRRWGFASLSADGLEVGWMLDDQSAIVRADATTGRIKEHADPSQPLVVSGSVLRVTPDNVVYDVSAGRPLAEFPRAMISMSPHETLVLVARLLGPRQVQLDLHDPRESRVLAARTLESRGIESISWLAGSRMLAVMHGGAAELLDARTLEHAGYLRHGRARGPLWALADIDTGYVGMWADGHVVHWPRSIESLPPLYPTPFQIYSTVAAVSEQGDRFVTCDWGAVTLWDARTGEPLWRRSPTGAFIRAVAFSPDARRIAIHGSQGRVLILDAADGRTIAASPIKSAASVTALAWTRDGSRLWAGYDNGDVITHSVERLREPGDIITRFGCAIEAMALSSGDRIVIIGAGNGRWTGELTRDPPPDSRPWVAMLPKGASAPAWITHLDHAPSSLAIAPDDTRAALGMNTGIIWTCAIETGQPGPIFETGGSEPIHAVRWLTGASGPSRVAAGTERRLYIIDESSGEALIGLQHGADKAIGFVPHDGSLIVVGTRSSTILERRLPDAVTLATRERIRLTLRWVSPLFVTLRTHARVLEAIESGEHVPPADVRDPMFLETARRIVLALNDHAAALNSDALVNLQRHDQEPGLYEYSLTLVQAAIAAMPDEPHPLRTQALAYERLGRIPEAIDSLNQAARLTTQRGLREEPFDALRMAILHHRLGHVSETRASAAEARRLLAALDAPSRVPYAALLAELEALEADTHPR